MKIIESRNYFTGDRYADQILTVLTNYLEDKQNIIIDDYEVFYDEAGLEKYVEFIFNEFPLSVDTPNFEYDAEWAWNAFLETKAGQKALEWIENYSPVIKSIYLLDELDDNVIADTNPLGKKLKVSDRKEIVKALEGEMGEFKNGYTWNPSEYVSILMSNHDGEHTYEDIRKEMNNYKKYAQNGELIGTWYTDYNDVEVLVLYSIDLEEIAKLALQ